LQNEWFEDVERTRTILEFEDFILQPEIQVDVNVKDTLIDILE